MTSPRRDLDKLFRGIVTLEGLVNQSRGALGLAELFAEEGRLSETLDAVEHHLIRAREEILHRCSVDATSARLSRSRR